MLLASFNPFKQNVISHFYHLDQYISVLRVVERYFSFLFKFNRTFCKQTVETLIRHMQCLIWVCNVCLCPIKRKLGLYWLIVVCE